MQPRIEVYVNVQSEWANSVLADRLRSSLERLLPDLMTRPHGPAHVLSGLEVVEISIVDDATIARVHAEYLDDPSATDVITFPYGEVIVSCDTAAAYAAAHGLSREEELFRYMVHGLCHLHGYLDGAPAEREALFAVQEPLVEAYWTCR